MGHAVVAGAGIGGLTAALALRAEGWSVAVYERAPALEAIGAGLVVAPNALRALDAIDLGDPIRRLAAFEEAAAGVRRHDGTWLVKTDQSEAEERWGDLAVVMSRADLVAALADRLGAEALHLGVTVEGVDPASGDVATTAGTVRGDLVVAADGVRSPIRSALFDDHPGPVYSGETAWRWLIPGVPMRVGGVEYWGPGGAIATMPLADRALYMYAAALVPPGRAADDERRLLLERFGAWTEPLPDLLAMTEPGSVLRNDVYHLATPLPAFHRGRVAVLGDAAHAMVPHLGQGACQAIEDAVVLAHEVTRGDGLDGYTRARLPRTTEVARASLSTMRLAMTANPILAALRNTGIRLADRIAPKAGLRRLDPILSWCPPTD